MQSNLKTVKATYDGVCRLSLALEINLLMFQKILVVIGYHKKIEKSFFLINSKNLWYLD